MSVEIRRLDEQDLPEADRLFRLAFGTFIGLPDPMAFGGDADYVKARWTARPEAALGAYDGGQLVGSNFAADWGSFGFFGPLTIRPDLWDKGIAKQLLGATMDLFKFWDIRRLGLFTFPQSTKHVGLYQKFGFWPHYLTAVMNKPVNAAAAGPGTLFSTLDGPGRAAALAAGREVTGSLFAGLDLIREIEAVAAQNLGDTVLIENGDGMSGFAICHRGAGSEAGSEAVYVKFAAVRPGAKAEEHFARLLAACDAFAVEEGAKTLIAGVNTARHGAYRGLIDAGFRTLIQGVAMQNSLDPGFNQADAFVLDDWR